MVFAVYTKPAGSTLPQEVDLLQAQAWRRKFGVMVCVTYSTGNCPAIVDERIPAINTHFIEEETIMLFSLEEKGQGLVEYAIILALVALIVIAVLWLLGPNIGNSYSSISSSIP